MQIGYGKAYGNQFDMDCDDFEDCEVVICNQFDRDFNDFELD